MLDALEVTHNPGVTAAVIHLQIPREDIQKEMAPAIKEVLAAVSDQGIGPSGPLFAHHLKTSSTRFDFEVGFPVTAPVTPVGRVKPSQLPNTTVVRAVYHGPYEGLKEAWAEFGKRAEGEFGARAKAEGYKPGTTLWETYLLGPESNPDPSTWQTQLNRPILIPDPSLLTPES